MPMTLFRSMLFAVCTVAVAAAHAQSDTLNLECKLGSFKILDAKGEASFSFEGTMLLVGVKGDLKVEGNVKKEFDNPAMQRVAYFGKGKVTVKGSFRAIQWFGSNLKGYVKGTALVRLTGEFDQNLDTGFYWYGDKVAERMPWFTSGLTVPVPENPRWNPKPVRRGGYGGG